MSLSICSSCGIRLENGVYYTSMNKVITSDNLQDICKLSNNKAACINKVLPSIRTLTNIELNDLTTKVISDLKISGIQTNFPDHFVTLEWLNIRKTPVLLDYRYAATTYLTEIDGMISIMIDFVDSINEGYLSFLRPELMKGIKLSGRTFDLFEGDKVVARGAFV